MAFHQPTAQAMERLVRVVTDDRVSQAAPHQPEQRAAPSLNESQSWVLFSPATDATTTTSYLSSVHESQITPGRSRVSALGSLETIARSDAESEAREAGSLIDEDIAESDIELDSLDGHLPEFRALPTLYHQNSQDSTAGPVFPAHDGLGSFHLETEATRRDVQERLYSFEKFNPRRIRRRGEGFDLAQLQAESEQLHEVERIQRIEEWRLEQSRILLDQIQKETRRRRQSETSMQRRRSDVKAEDLASLNGVPESKDVPMNDWHEQDAEESSEEEGGFLGRMTRRFIRDFMGIDDRMLSILFGEALPEDEDLSSTPKASMMASSTPAPPESHQDSAWQTRMLERIAKELGALVNQMTSHPGAFSTYTHMQQMPIPYAGLPVIHESAMDAPEPSAATAPEASISMPQFEPTIRQKAHPIDIPGAKASVSTTHTVTQPATTDASSVTPSSTTFTQDEWEQDLDLKLVFKYFRSRFSSRSNSPAPGTSHLATSSTQDSAAKAARVRLQHPLVGRTRPAERRSFKAVASPSSPVARRAPSCASHSTRRSARKSSASSRHYWDLGGSQRTGSLIASTGPMGGWAEA